MIAAIGPISGFMSLGPVMPVSLGGALGAAAPAALVGLPSASTIVSLAGATSAAGVPLTYTATGNFRTSVQVTPLGTTPTTGTPGMPVAQRVHLEFDADLDLLIIRDRATAGTPLSSLPPDTVRRLADAMTTDLLLASMGASSGSTGNLAGSMLTSLFGGSSPFGGGSSFLGGGSSLFGSTFGVNPLLGNMVTLNPTTTATTPITSVTGTVTTNLTLTVSTTPATATAPATTAPAATAVSTALPATAAPATPAAVTAAPAAAVTAPAATVVVTPTPAATATPGGAAAADTALQRFLTDAAARALDTITNNPSYAAAAASLYASVALMRNQNELATLAVPGRDDAVRQINPTVAVQALPSSVA